MIRFDGHPATVYSLAFSPDSMLLASGAKDGGVRLWDAAGVMVQDFDFDSQWARNAIAWAPSGDWLATSNGARLFILRPDGELRTEGNLPYEWGEITSLGMASDNLLAAGIGVRNNKGPGSLYLWNTARKASPPVPRTISGADGVRAVAVHATAKRIHWIAGLPNTSACVWRSWVITSPNATDVKLGKPASAITVSSDGTTVAIATDWLVKVFTAEGKMMGELTGHKGQVTGVGFIHGGRTVVSASWDETVRFWDVATKKETARFPVGIGKLTALAVSPDGTRVAAGGTDGPIVLIDAE